MSANLLCDGRLLCSVEVADTFTSRLKGLAGRPSIDGAMMITRTSSVHTFGMQFALDIAFIDADMFVDDVTTMAPRRLTWPRRRARSVLEAPAGAFAEWGVKRGSKIEIRP